MTTQQPLNVLVSAFNFSPIKGSEFATGWNYVRAIARRHKVWVIARSNEREETEIFLRTHREYAASLFIHFIPFPADSSFRFFLHEVPYYLMYRLWHWKAYQLALELDKSIHFDIVHHVCGTGFREPGYLWKMEAPFVWGPVNGMHLFPLQLLGAVNLRYRPFILLKTLSKLWALHFARRPRKAAARAREILVAFDEIANKVHLQWKRESVVLSEVSAPDIQHHLPAPRSSGEPLQILWCGRFDPGKALNILLFALSRLHSSAIDWKLTAIGDGILAKEWKALARSLGLQDRCAFPGNLSRSEVLTSMAKAHCFVHSSLYDGTPTVVAEALANGLPVICLDQFGCRQVVRRDCGITIFPGKLHLVIEGFADAIRLLWSNEPRRFRMALAAQRASTLLTWQHKSTVLAAVYERVLCISPPSLQ